MCKNYCFLKPVLLSLCLITNIVLSQNSVTDVDGNVYNYSTYGTQIWTIQNAAMETYRDGTPIPQVTDFTTWENSTTGAWCYYNNDPTKGKLYNWYAVAGIHDNDPNTPNKEFAPQGWKVPSDQDWTTLEEYLIANGYNYDGTTTGNKIAKALASSTLWNSSTITGAVGNNQNLNNSSGFNALPTGDRLSGNFSDQGGKAHFWTSSENLTNGAYGRSIRSDQIDIIRGNGGNKYYGNAVRFIQADCQISASSTEVCAGESVTLTAISNTGSADLCDLPASLQTDLVGYWPFCGNANDESGNGNNGTVNGATLTTDRFGNTDSAYLFDGSTSIINLPEISPDIGTPGTVTTYSMWFKGNAPIQGGGSNGQILSAKSPTTNDFYIRFEVTYVGDHFLKVYYRMPTESDEPFSLFENSSPTWHNIIVEINSVTGDYNYYFDGVNIPEMNFTFNPSNNYYTPSRNWQIGRMDPPPNGFQPHAFQGSIDDIGVWNRALTPTEISSLYNSNFTTYLWSTGDTTETISVTPTETTEYWVDVSTNGVTCREYVTINVTAPAAPTGDSEQTFCEASTVADLTVTGENIQWYDAVTGGNLLDPTSALTDGQMVYASKTVNGCESTDRLEVSVSLQDITITASATEVCAGESVDLTVSSGLTADTTACTSADLPANLQTGLVGYWPFCGNANDESENGNNGTVNGATLTSDRFGNADSAYDFDGDDDYINIGNNEYLNFNNNFSISCFINVDSTDPSDNIIINNEGLYEIGLSDLNNTLKYAISNDNPGWDWQDITPISNNQWYHIALTYNQGEINFYLDGALIYIYQGSGILSDFHPGLDDLRFGGRMFNNSKFNGSIDNIAIWNRALTETEVQQLANSSTYLWSTGDTTETISVTPTETTEYWVDVTTNGVTCREYVTINVTAPAAPTGDAEQTFCDTATVADLTATGENIQWYDSATGGNLLDSTTVLTDGQMVYASQTVDGCESEDRLMVTVSVQEITITASGTEVCAGEQVDLSVSASISSNGSAGNLVEQAVIPATTNNEQIFSTTIGLQYRLEISGLFSGGTYCPQLAYSPAFVLAGFYGNATPAPRAMQCDNTQAFYSSIFCENPGLRPNPDTYNGSHTYDYYFTAISSNITVGFFDLALGDNCGSFSFKLYENSTPSNTTTYLWSTGDTTETISVTPTETTEYWVDVTVNGVTCREFVTITVTAPAAPTGEAEQTFCSGATLADLVATGTAIQWYDAATGGNLLDPTTALTNGQVVYASQAVDGCESEDRLMVTVSVQEITITASATEVCAGESVDLSVSASVLGSFSNWNTNEPNNAFGPENWGEIFSYSQNQGKWNDFSSNNIYSVIEYNGLITSLPGCVYIGQLAGHSYFYKEINGSWTVASNHAISLGGYLAIINSQVENDLISQNIPIPNGFGAWIGMYQDIQAPNYSEPNGGWKWVDGSDVEMNSNMNSATYLWSTGDTTETISVTPTETTEYWVDVTTNGVTCREYLTITVNEFPDQPVSGGDITECESTSSQNLIATAFANAGESIIWYDAATGGSIVADPSLSAEGTVTYFAEATNDTSGCASLTRTAVTLTITSVAAPTGEPVQSFCDNVSVSDLLATGSNIQWYDAATGGNLLDPSSALSDGQLLYTSQTQNGCESITRLEVSVEIDIIPDPILITTELDFCLAREATLADLEVADQGFALEWYDNFSGGNMLPMDALLEDGVSYYATLYDAVSGCESLMRLEVVPTVIPCEVVIYNALSLNDNGINDYMVIENAEYFPDNNLQVFNRDGHLIYTQNQYGIGDNFFRGIANVSGIFNLESKLPTGSYLYVFNYFNPYEQEWYTLKGFLTINSN